MGHIGIGHTRWATHGVPSERNAHPHLSMNRRVVVVHNAIVENFLPLREELMAEGVKFNSDTDTEVIVQMVERYLEAGVPFIKAVQDILKQLQGANAVVVFNVDEPDRLICARLGNAGGITLGIGEGEMFIASDIPAILEYTRRVVFLESRQMAEITQTGYQVSDLDGRLAELAEDRRADTLGRKDARSKQAGVRFARWFVVVVPLGMALAGLSLGDGRVAYQSGAGQVLVVIGIGLMAACWVWSGRMLRLPEARRVFG